MMQTPRSRGENSAALERGADGSIGSGGSMASTQQAGGPEPALAEDEAGFKRGRSGMLWGLSLACAILLAGLWQLLSGDDQARVYGEIGRKINGLRQAHFDQFWACALSGKNLQDLKSNTDVIGQLDGRAAQSGRAYAAHLRTDCAPKLTEIEPQLDSLIAPEDMKSGIEDLKAATSKLRSSTSAFISFLDVPEQPYETDKATPLLTDIARAWYDYRNTQATLNKTLKSKLQTP